MRLVSEYKYLGILWVPYLGFLESKSFEAKSQKNDFNFASLMFAYLRQTWIRKWDNIVVTLKTRKRINDVENFDFTDVCATRKEI